MPTLDIIHNYFELQKAISISYGKLVIGEFVHGGANVQAVIFLVIWDGTQCQGLWVLVLLELLT